MDTPHSKSVVVQEEIEMEKLAQAYFSSMQKGNMLPLIKEELKYLIQSRRVADGKDELRVRFHSPQKHQLEPEDKVRIKKRKEQNKTAAKRFRIKKKIILDQQYTDLELQKSRNQELRAKIDDLMRQITMYRAVLVQHVPGIENLYPPK